LIDVCETAAKANGFTAMEMGATLPGVPLYAAMGYTEIERIDTVLPDGVEWEIVRMRKDFI